MGFCYTYLSFTMSWAQFTTQNIQNILFAYTINFAIWRLRQIISSAGACSVAFSELEHTAQGKNLTCPDSSSCPSDTTCCQMKSGRFACCPMKNAVCCADQIHCCAEGQTCDNEKGICLSSEQRPSAPNKLIPTEHRSQAKVYTCPDNSTCAQNYTCCEMSDGWFGCCPITNGICCADKLHCCPPGQECDNIYQTCKDKTSESAPTLIRKQQKNGFKEHTAQGKNLTCPDSSSCPSDTTCCQMKSGRFACCPMKNAVCCADQIHCCAEGQTCDNEKGICLSSEQRPSAPNKLIPTEHRSQAKVTGDHVCPDGKSKCPDQTTCCEMESGAYGCCPMEQAVCCPDKIHCCQHGDKCDEKGGACKGSDGVMRPWQSKLAAQMLFEENNLFEPEEFNEYINQKNVASTKNCPDKTSHCPDNNTCCANNKGAYDCCPVPEAMCCPDKVHCCPKGFECDTQKGDCTSLTSEKRVARLKFKDNKDQTCADNATICPQDYTCCLLSKTEYGCCPLPKAVCCSDMLHCCPNGFKCNSKDATCSKGFTSMPWFDKVSGRRVNTLGDSRRFEVVNNVICPDQTSQCPEGSTCCKLASGEYGCCPVPKAVCCSDKVHCCPNSYTCDAAGLCTKGETSIPWLSKLPATRREPLEIVDSVICPDKRSECPDGNTCCVLTSGEYGCCPLPNAVCCSDKVHCCPNSYTCDAAGLCTKGETAIPWLSKLPAINGKQLETVICPGHKSECPDGSTCCKLTSGEYGCCPLPKAVCCQDHVHCCPEGYTCETTTGSCQKGATSIPWFIKAPAAPIPPSNGFSVKCAGMKASCPDNTTCCELPKGGFGCCPVPKAVCCEDHKHCCPKGYKCDIQAGQCHTEDGSSVTPWLEKFPAWVHGTKDTPCPGHKSKCSGVSTCCAQPSGEYKCCPIAEAVCCSDHQHCCPKGYKCDNRSKTCYKGLSSLPWISKSSAQPIEEDVNKGVKCADSTQSCPLGTTCCKVTKELYGCCPLPKAVCCKDQVHCCPNGHTCDFAEGACKNGAVLIPWSTKIPAYFSTESRIKEKSVICPDKKSLCPDLSTCCVLPSGEYGCCPIPKAVCCSDHEPCCPEGYTCDVTQGTCTMGAVSVPWLQKTASSSVTPSVSSSSVICPDQTSQCPDGSTCCMLSSGEYGCCPVPDAVCCSDHEHCCPEGYTCDVAQGTCTMGAVSVPWLQKTASSSVTPSVSSSSVICPDQTSQCPDGSTCCMLSSGEYGCCPLPQAVCCSDHEHCCPSGYTCATAEGTCEKGAVSIPWSRKIPASVSAKSSVEDKSVICPDQKSECPDGSTCCVLPSGEYGCCPIPKAVCCSDHEHCCPEGYTCDVTQGTCTKSDYSQLQQDIVQCADNKTTCPNGFTCCQMNKKGALGCCPLPNAVCCKDYKHCCPAGSTCDIEAQTCTQLGSSLQVTYDDIVHPLKLSSKLFQKVEIIKCSDGSTCPDGSTCCQQTGGTYACCPHQKAVCCADKVHCCPGGYACHKSKNGSATCQKGTISISAHMHSRIRAKFPPVISIPWYTKVPGTPVKQSKISNALKFEPLAKSDSKIKPNSLSAILSPTDKNVYESLDSSVKKMAAYEAVSVFCPGGEFECPSRTTCCPLKSGSWGCCPSPKAVCCSDGIHCCPQGYTCDVAGGSCKKAQDSEPIDLIELLANKRGSP